MMKSALSYLLAFKYFWGASIYFYKGILKEKIPTCKVSMSGVVFALFSFVPGTGDFMCAYRIITNNHIQLFLLNITQ